MGNRKLANGRHQRQKVTRPPAVSRTTHTERTQAKVPPEMNNLREANKIAKAGY